MIDWYNRRYHLLIILPPPQIAWLLERGTSDGHLSRLKIQAPTYYAKMKAPTKGREPLNCCALPRMVKKDIKAGFYEPKTAERKGTFPRHSNGARNRLCKKTFWYESCSMKDFGAFRSNAC